MSANSNSTIVDAGPLAALLSRSDQFKDWAEEQFAATTPPMLTCEAALSEAQLLIGSRGGDPLVALELVQRGILEIDFSLRSELDRILELQRSYRNVPMSLADACIVRMSELRPRCRVMTTDSDFRIYRRNRRNVIPLLAPPGV
jgi:uncharacterized protein